jgi:hypothetical protein
LREDLDELFLLLLEERDELLDFAEEDDLLDLEEDELRVLLEFDGLELFFDPLEEFPQDELELGLESPQDDPRSLFLDPELELGRVSPLLFELGLRELELKLSPLSLLGIEVLGLFLDEKSVRPLSRDVLLELSRSGAPQ